MKSRTLEEIIRAEQSHRHEGGQFGIDACKKSIRFSVEYLGENLADLLNEYVERANADAFFNKAMVLACWELMQEAEAEAETEATINETKKAEIMAIVNRICADNNTDCRGLSLSGMASDLLDAVGIDPYLDIFEIPVHSDNQVCICFWFNGEPFELWAGLSYETKEFFTECRRWSEDANGEIVNFSMFAEEQTEEEPKGRKGKKMKNYIGRRGTEADRINAVIEAYEATRDGKTASDALTVEALNEYEAKHGSRAAADLLALVPADRFAGDHAEALNRLEDRATRREEAEERQRQTDEENRRHCESIASELDDIASGRLYICPLCGDWTEAEEDADGEIRCAHCGEIIDPDYCEQVTMYDYFNDCFDIEYTINSEGEYKGVRVMVACGGPNIYVDTVRRSVNLYWWTDTASAPLWSDTIEAIDQDFEELYTCTR